jgi:hypothetical protein
VSALPPDERNLRLQETLSGGMGLLPIYRARPGDHNEELPRLIRLAVRTTLQAFRFRLVLDVNRNRSWLRLRLRAIIFRHLSGGTVGLRSGHEAFLRLVHQEMVELAARANAAVLLRKFLPEDFAMSARLAVTQTSRKICFADRIFTIQEPGAEYAHV